MRCSCLSNQTIILELEMGFVVRRHNCDILSSYSFESMLRTHAERAHSSKSEHAITAHGHGNLTPTLPLQTTGSLSLSLASGAAGEEQKNKKYYWLV